MARPPPEDPRITDLRRYKKAREQAKRRPPPRPPGQGLIGSNPRAKLILGIVVAVLVAIYVLPLVMKVL